jgi:hypothetical protein
VQAKSDPSTAVRAGAVKRHDRRHDAGAEEPGAPLLVAEADAAPVLRADHVVEQRAVEGRQGEAGSTVFSPPTGAGMCASLVRFGRTLRREARESTYCPTPESGMLKRSILRTCPTRPPR